MGKELNSLIGNFSLGYCASYMCSLTFSPKEPVPYYCLGQISLAIDSAQTGR